MFPQFLPASVNLLSEPSAIKLAQSIQRQPIATPLHQQPIDTASVRFGSGSPILLLHGFDSSVLEFRRLIPLLATDYETWAVDLLGFGFSDRPHLSYTPKSIKTHLYCFWKTLLNHPVILVGASMGGATAIDFTLTYPEAVDKLVLINSVGFTGSFPFAQFLSPPFDAFAVEFWRQRRVQSLFWGQALNLLDSTAIDAIRCAALPAEMPGWDNAIASFMKSGGYFDLAPKIPQVNKPTLILWGERDDVLGTADAHKFNQAIAHSQLVWLHSGHVPQWEQPQALAAQILCFLRSLA